MSVRIFVGDQIKDDSQFKKVTPRPENQYTLNGIRIDYDKNRRSFYHPMDLLEDEFPEELAGFVEKISIRAALIISSPRRSGRYSSSTAEGFVESFTFEGEKVLIMVTGPNFDDAQDLFFKILRGEVLPYEDWEKKQISPNTNKKVL
ncbi:MAG: hypothetical protein PHI45_00605 [Candidatus Pacebacteria bacterium]|nr:hypothetical protein [Candidatus Paceibacterota bacterium]